MRSGVPLGAVRSGVLARGDAIQFHHDSGNWGMIMTDARQTLGSMGDSLDISPSEVEKLREYQTMLGLRAPDDTHEMFLGLGLVEEKLGGPAITLKGRAILRRLG
jgi:hypothetical protein